jgi:tetratricopeptide (TPR) repeat protein
VVQRPPGLSLGKGRRAGGHGLARPLEAIRVRPLPERLVDGDRGQLFTHRDDLPSEVGDRGLRLVERHYSSRALVEPASASWKALRARPEVALVLRNYKQAFLAKKLLDQGKPQDAYATARTAITGRTATDAYPNWVLARAAFALGRSREGIEALRRAVTSSEPVPNVYEDLIVAHEGAGNLPAALEWTDQASKTFGGAPRWMPHKIRLLRKTGRVAEANTATIDCSLNATDWKRLCHEANAIPQAARRANLPRG